MPIERAERLEDIYRAFDPAPLEPSELHEFYVNELNGTRGADKIQRLALGLKRLLKIPSRNWERDYYKAFVMGHAGVGISTELSRLSRQLEGEFRTFRFSANGDLDPVNFKPFDVILILALNLAEETAKPVEEGGAGSSLPDVLTRRLLDWFATEKVTAKTSYEVSLSSSASASPTPALPWQQLVGLSASLKAEAKRASGRSREVTEYRLQNINQLADLANEVIEDCNRRMFAATGVEWLVIGDDFDKPGIPEKQISELFITYGNLLTDLRCHLILDIPIGLGHSSRSNQLPPRFEGPYNFPDTPVYTPEHTPHGVGRAALRRIVETRMNPDLCADHQIERLIVASGGNLRELFGLIIESATNAELRGSEPWLITNVDVDPAIRNLRKEYRDHLGENSYDVEKIKLEDKLAKLAAVYHGDPLAKVHDATLYSLLHARAVQEFNGTGWFGVHPLTTDFLNELALPELSQDRDASGRLPGGTI